MGSWIGNVAGPILGASTSKKGAKNAGGSAAQSQEDLMNAAIGRYQQMQKAQRAGIMGMAGMTNPFQQAAQGMHPFFSVPGQDSATFGPTSMAGQQTTAAPNNAAFFAPPPPPTPAPPTPPQNNGWGGGMNKYFARQQ